VCARCRPRLGKCTCDVRTSNTGERDKDLNRVGRNLDRPARDPVEEPELFEPRDIDADIRWVALGRLGDILDTTRDDPAQGAEEAQGRRRRLGEQSVRANSKLSR
jgi:hypothetical protein